MHGTLIMKENVSFYHSLWDYGMCPVTDRSTVDDLPRPRLSPNTHRVWSWCRRSRPWRSSASTNTSYASPAVCSSRTRTVTPTRFTESTHTSRGEKNAAGKGRLHHLLHLFNLHYCTIYFLYLPPVNHITVFCLLIYLHTFISKLLIYFISFVIYLSICGLCRT